MMFTYADLILKNSGDVSKAEEGLIPQKQVRTAEVRALVDTGSGTLVISEELRSRLGLKIQALQRTTVAGGGIITCQVTGPVKVCWQDRFADCNALVMPGEQQTLLGAVPMEVMDLTINPKRQIVEAAHGAEWVFMVK